MSDSECIQCALAPSHTGGRGYKQSPSLCYKQSSSLLLHRMGVQADLAVVSSDLGALLAFRNVSMSTAKGFGKVDSYGMLWLVVIDIKSCKLRFSAAQHF